MTTSYVSTESADELFNLKQEPKMASNNFRNSSCHDNACLVLGHNEQNHHPSPEYFNDQVFKNNTTIMFKEKDAEKNNGHNKKRTFQLNLSFIEQDIVDLDLRLKENESTQPGLPSSHFDHKDDNFNFPSENESSGSCTVNDTSDYEITQEDLELLYDQDDKIVCDDGSSSDIVMNDESQKNTSGDYDTQDPDTSDSQNIVNVNFDMNKLLKNNSTKLSNDLEDNIVNQSNKRRCGRPAKNPQNSGNFCGGKEYRYFGNARVKKLDQFGQLTEEYKKKKEERAQNLRNFRQNEKQKVCKLEIELKDLQEKIQLEKAQLDKLKQKLAQSYSENRPNLKLSSNDFNRLQQLLASDNI